MRLFRSVVMMTVMGVLAAACGGDAAPASTTSTTIPATTTSTLPPAPVTTATTAPETATTTTEPGPSMENRELASEGDKNETVASVQWLINCAGWDELVVDGSFGPATKAGVQTAQESLGQSTDGVIDDELVWGVSRHCTQQRVLSGAEVIVIGNTDPEDPEVYRVALLAGSALEVGIVGDVTLVVATDDGTELPPDEGGTWMVEESGTYLLSVLAPAEIPVTYTLSVNLASGGDGGGWILATDGISYGDTTLEMGDDAETVIDEVTDILGHGVRGRYAEFDTGWSDDPGNIGLRGVFIEGLAFLFYGPSTDYPGYAERLARIRFEGPGYDADGNARPANYVTTAEGVTVGHDLGFLRDVYGESVKAGNSASEYYYRYADSGGELCFYFGGSKPTNASVILEIATQCRE